MGTLTREDYYYGALLSVFINGGFTPALFHEKEDKNRQIYKVSTNKGDYLVYAKFNTSPTGTEDFTWSFTLTPGELSEIKRYKSIGEELTFAFICSQKHLGDRNQEIAFVYWDEFQECVDLNEKDHKGTPRISIRLIKGARNFRVYGSRKSDIFEGKDNTLHIKRNRLKNL